MADKQGNRFEKRWIVQQLLHLLAGHIHSVKYEPVGLDEKGVDLWITRLDWRREAQQCKGEQGIRPEWSMADLARRSILGHLREQLQRDGAHEFALVSATPAGILRDLARSARDSETAKQFWEYSVRNRSGTHRDEFLRFCEALGLDHEVQADLESAFDLLRRSHFHLFSDDSQTRRSHETWASCFVSGPADRVLDALSAFAENEGNFRREIHAGEVYAYLRSKGHPPRDLARDERLPVLAKELCDRFCVSIRSHLTAGRLIPRQETQSILDWVEYPGRDRLLLLHGPAGQGKSGILYEVAVSLEARGIPFLPFQLDRQHPQVSAQRFGVDRGLPASPAMCLKHLAGERTSVLLIDQLDALRWTSAHSSEAFSICQEMIREAMQLGDNLLVVIGCRTFDLEHDPQIRKWEREQIFSRKVAVSPLPEAAIREVVDHHGFSFDSLSPREKQLLSNVQNLTMWTEIADSGETPRFSTVTELSRKFWQTRREEIARRGVPALEVEALLDEVTAYMESRSRLDAPERLLEQHPVASDALQSLNVLQVADRRVSFCHQSYLDYQVARKLLGEIDSGSASVLTWLGGLERQSLFRREQLRLVLVWMRDEDSSRFLSTLRELLSASGVRFHLKQAALQVLGQIDNPSRTECEFVTGLLRDPGWRDHASDHVLWGNSGWFEALDERGEWQESLASNDEARVAFALHLMRVVTARCGDRVARLLDHYVDGGGEWPGRCTFVLPFDPSEGSDALFELRLRLVRHGEGREIVYLPDLARKSPHRFIRLVALHVDRRLEPGSPEVPVSAYDRLMGDPERFDRKERLAFRAAGRAEPSLALDLLLSAARRIASTGDGWWAFHRYVHRMVPACVAECLVAAAAAELHRDPECFFGRIESITDTEPSLSLSLILSALTYGPDTIADRALRWVLSRPASLRSGDRFETSEWEPARRLLHRFCRRCTDTAYAEVEDFLLHYTDDDERRSMIRRHEWVLGGELDYPNRRGQTQYHLLPALPGHRKSGAVAGLEGMLCRKFATHKDSIFNSHRNRGGTVTSPMRAEPQRLSDVAWLRLIANNAEKDGPRSARYYEGYCTEASPAVFAGDLGHASRRDPARFARLAPRIPADANPVYLNAILNGLADKKPPENLPEDVRKAWIAPPLAVLDPVIQAALDRRDPSHAGALCRILRERPELPWPSETMEGVLRLAMAEGPTDSSTHSRSLRKETGPPPVNDLEQRSINCLRGEIAWTVESLLWGDIARLPLVKSTMDELVADPDPAVRVATVGACGPTWNVDKDLASRWFAEACAHEDDRVTACHEVWHLMWFIANSHPEAAHSIIRRMIDSSHPEVAKAGAAHATYLWIYKGLLETEARSCRTGRAELRRGAALAAADLARGDDHSSQAIEILVPLLDDSDDDVRNESDAIFRSRDLLSRLGMRHFLQAYIKTRRFRDNQWLLMHTIKEHAGSLLPMADLVWGVVEMSAGPLLDASRDPANSAWHGLSELAPLLIRLYEQAEDADQTDIRERCLDAWDLLLERRVGLARSLTSAMDG